MYHAWSSFFAGATEPPSNRAWTSCPTTEIYTYNPKRKGLAVWSKRTFKGFAQCADHPDKDFPPWFCWTADPG
jgi:hypothetical protein